MSAPATPAADDAGAPMPVEPEGFVPDAAEVWAYVDYFRKLRRRRALGRYAYAIYLVSIVALFYAVAPLVRAAQALAATDASREAANLRVLLPTTGTVLLALLVLAVLRGATWHGPVSLSAADAEWLLPLPVDMVGVLRTRARRAMTAGLILGAVAGVFLATALGLAVVRTSSTIGPLLITGAGVGAALGVTAVATGVFVQRWPSAGRTVLTATVPVVLVALAVVIAARWSDIPGQVASWSGPWGWSTVLLGDAARLREGGIVPAAALLAALATATSVVADRQAGRIGFGTLRAQAAGTAGLRGALFVGETRDVLLRIREARGVRIHRWHVPAPRAAVLILAWRDAVALVRAPARTGGAVLLAGFGAAALAAGWTSTGATHVLAAIVAALCCYLAALVLVEPARVDADDPTRSAPLPFSFRTIARRHVAVPTVLLAVLGLIATPALVHWGGITLPHAVVGVCCAAPVAVTAALAGAFRGRVPLYILFSGGDYGIGGLALWFLGPLLIGVGLICVGELVGAGPDAVVIGAVAASGGLLSWTGSRAHALVRL